MYRNVQNNKHLCNCIHVFISWYFLVLNVTQNEIIKINQLIAQLLIKVSMVLCSNI